MHICVPICTKFWVFPQIFAMFGAPSPRIDTPRLLRPRDQPRVPAPRGTVSSSLCIRVCSPSTASWRRGPLAWRPLDTSPRTGDGGSSPPQKKVCCSGILWDPLPPDTWCLWAKLEPGSGPQQARSGGWLVGAFCPKRGFG